MNINYNFTSVLDFITLLHGLIIGIVLIVSHNRQGATVYLGLFLLTYSIELVTAILRDIGLRAYYPALFFLPTRFYFLNAVFFFFYVKKLIYPFHLRINWPHLIPGLIEFLLLSTLLLSFLLTDSETLLEVSKKSYRYYFFSSLIFSIVYEIMAIRIIGKHQLLVLHHFSNLHLRRLKWVKYLSLTLIIFQLTWFITPFLSQEVYDKFYYPAYSYINLAIVYWIAIAGLRQPKILIDPIVNDDEIGEKKLPNDVEKFQDLNELIKQKELYKDPHLSLVSLAEQAGLTRNEISYLINKNNHTNFNVFINHYRVEEAKKLLTNPANNHLNMLGIAIQAGFNSKATFFSVFKQHEGKSPGTYKQQSTN